MKHKIIVGLFLLFSVQGFSQGLKVLISEKKSGKRVVLFAENKTNDTLNVFLMVNSEGFRKSANKPVIKNIPPATKVSMLTMIEMSDVPSTYTYDLIVNEDLTKTSISTENQAKDIEKQLYGKLVLFTNANCTDCTQLITELNSKRIPHRVFDINKDQVIYRQFMAHIERSLTVETKIRFPIIWNKEEVIFGYDNVDDVLKRLKH